MPENEDLNHQTEMGKAVLITEGPSIEITTADFDKLHVSSKLIREDNENYLLEMSVLNEDGTLVESRNVKASFRDKKHGWDLESDEGSNRLTNEAFENILQWLSNTLGSKLSGKKNFLPWDKEIPHHLFLTFNRQIHEVEEENAA